MLKSIIEQDDFNIRICLQNGRDRQGTLLAYRYRDMIFELRIKLKWFVAKSRGAVTSSRQPKTFSLPSIPSAECGDPMLLIQQSNQVFNHRRFSRSSNTKIANANHRHFKLGRRFYSSVI